MTSTTAMMMKVALMGAPHIEQPVAAGGELGRAKVEPAPVASDACRRRKYR